MDGRARARTLLRLRAEIAAIERRPLLAGATPLPWQAGIAAFAAPPGLLHEVFTDEPRNTGATLGFALGQGLSLVGPGRPAIVYLQLAADGQETGLPFGPGLARLGVPPEALVLVRTASFTELAWAIEETVGCRAVAAVVADAGHNARWLDFTASRRLSLRATAAGASVFLIRYGTSREASAAQLRWRVMPAASGPPEFDARAPGAPRFSVGLEKGRIAEGRAGDTWLIEWTENGFTPVEDQRSAALPAARPAAHGAAPATLADRLPQAG